MCLAIPGKLVRVADADDPLRRNGQVNFGGLLKQVNLAYVPEAKVGDYVIVHAGFALSVLDPVEAERTLEDFRRISALESGT